MTFVDDTLPLCNSSMVSQYRQVQRSNEAKSHISKCVPFPTVQEGFNPSVPFTKSYVKNPCYNVVFKHGVLENHGKSTIYR